MLYIQVESAPAQCDFCYRLVAKSNIFVQHIFNDVVETNKSNEKERG